MVSAMAVRYQVFAENVEKMKHGYVRKKRALPGALFFVFLRTFSRIVNAFVVKTKKLHFFPDSCILYQAR